MQLVCHQSLSRKVSLQVVSVLLSKHVLMNYSKFVHGIDDIAALERDLQLAYSKVQEARVVLHTCSEDVSTSMRICQGSVGKHKAGQTLEVACKIQRTRDIAQDLRYAG